MEVTSSPRFIPTEEGKWVNLSLCDLIEIIEEKGRFWVCVWNAFQSNVSYKIRSFSTHQEANAFVESLLNSLSSR